MTPILDSQQIQNGLAELRKRKIPVFGSEAHGFKLNPPLSEKVIVQFERDHGVSLPQDYRNFLASIGNGGAGPSYGVFPLGQTDGLATDLVPWKEGDGFIGTLSMPFLLRDSWNDLSLYPPEELLEKDEAEYDRQIEKFEAFYFDSSRMNGALPICHMGCALRIWLVVTGEEAGYLWRDGRAENSGLSPLLLRDASKAQFSFWYIEWLDDAMSSWNQK